MQRRSHRSRPRSEVRRGGGSVAGVHSRTELISARHLFRSDLSTRTSALDARIFGVDVQSGDVRGDAPSYALVVFDGEVVERDVVSRRKLLRRLDDEEPAMLATDNMYELAADKDQLVHFLRGLPEETKLVQVTGDERPEPLSRVAKRHGVPYGKPAMEEAEAAARLASRSVGYEVSAFTDETEVKVARGRSTGGGGGWSEDRFTRRIHGSVKRATREVESELDEAGLEYDRDVTEKYGGYANAVFTVQARPEDIPVSSRRSGDTRVEIEPVRRDGIEFVPLARRRDRVFVGIDPGTTTAVALVALDGRVLDVMSTRTADTSEVIEWIIEHGRPVVVAADVTPMPDTVERIRASFDAAGWTPDSDLPIDEKQHRTREAGYENDHERDAMAAALFAHDDHADQIQRVTEEIPRELDRGDVVSRVVGNDESLTAVVADMTETEEPEPEPTAHDPRELTAEEQRIKDLEAQVERLQAHVSDLEADLEEKDETIAEYEDRLSEARREERQEAQERREVTRLQWENDRLETELEEERERADELEGKLERLKDLWKLDHSNLADVDGGEDLLAVKPVEQFTVDAIEAADDKYGIASGDVVYLRDASGAGRRTAELLADFEPRAVLRSGGLSDAADEVLFDHQIPVGPADDVTIREVDELAIASESDVEAVIEDWRDRKADREREQTETMVDSIISEHRADRD
jgi:predicted RNase H-like nuclease (RuvC/YqgF family)